ncbi:MAG: hypothetical protein KIH69_015115, partial [Anaerolineae bacterium]|nr:hypothetical protein [Anaerolineae bacterium]
DVYKRQGMTCAITNPIEHEIKRGIMAADLMMGHDENCLGWIAASRESAQAASASGAAPAPAVVSAADQARAEREARRASRRAAQSTSA